MAVIPTSVFRNVEWHLHHEKSLIKQAVSARDLIASDVLKGSGLPCDGLPRGKGGHSEATANKALTLVRASAEVERARAWVAAIRQTYAYFEDSKESAVFSMAMGYYGQGVTIRALADKLGTNEKTLDRQRDKFVSTCALFAAAGGVVGMEI